MPWLREFVRDLLPPLVLRAYRRARGAGLTLDGPYASWDHAQSKSSGYNTDVIVDRVRAAMSKVANGEAACERDSVTFDTKQYSFPFLTGLLRAALATTGPLKVLDFGGSLGTSYFLYRELLAGPAGLLWNIVEQPRFVACGSQYFQNNELRFFSDLHEALRMGRPDIVLLSGVLQYLEHPYCVLDAITADPPRYILIDRTPFRKTAPDVVAVQHVPPEIYHGSYPSWVFGPNLRDTLGARAYRVWAEWESGESDVRGPGSIRTVYRGLALEHVKSR